jgi:hypothetical protein
VPRTPSLGEVHWPPRAGDPLPRARDAWCDRVKLEDWVLAARGHGREWNRVFHVDIEDADLVWGAIAESVPAATITELRGEGDDAGYGVQLELAINGRIAPVLTAWHYAHEAASPRLVTAYPKPYNRGHGSHP